MGQAFRRATGRIRSSRVDTTSQLGKPIERRPPPPPPPPPPAVPVDKLPTDDVTHGSEGASIANTENVLEDRDPQYDAMLSQMVGRIQSKPGGKLEMGEAPDELGKPPRCLLLLRSSYQEQAALTKDLQKRGWVSLVEKYKRPLPKLRNTTPESGRYEARPAPPGTLNIAQIRQIILLYQGKSDDHDGPMAVGQIAERFRIDAAQVQNILQFVSLPPEDERKKKNNEE